MSAAQPAARLGRRPTTTHLELEHVAFELFAKQGFDRTTVDDIASAADIGRRTFFRYFATKNDVPWGNFEAELDRLRAWLDACPSDLPLMDAIRLAIVDFNTFPPEAQTQHRHRMQLILGVPALLAHSTLRFVQWRQVIADFVAGRTGQDAYGLIPQAIGHATLGVAVAAYQQWLRDDHSDLTGLLDNAMRGLAATLADTSPADSTGCPPSTATRGC
jgi:mycofactocin system transcriptional regulator